MASISQKEYYKQYYQNHKEFLDKKNWEWRLAHPKRIKEYGKKYRDSHREQVNRVAKKSRSKRKDYIKKYNENYYLSNKEKENARAVKYRQKNKHRIQIYNSKYVKENHDKFLQYNANRRARRRNASGTHTLQEWEILKKSFNYMCLCCKRFEPEVKLTRDHIVPLVSGGTNDIKNIQPLCLSCNVRKNKKTINFLDQVSVNKSRLGVLHDEQYGSY